MVVDSAKWCMIIHSFRILLYSTHPDLSGRKTCSCQGVLNTTLCDKVCQWLVTGQWFSSGPPVSYTNKNDHHDIAEILLKVHKSI